MKKMLLILFVLLLLMFVSVYLFIPTHVILSSQASVHSTSSATNRYLVSEKKWANWWPSGNGMDSSITVGNGYEYNGTLYHLTVPLYNGCIVSIDRDGIMATSRLSIIPIHKDSLILTWECPITYSINPLKRLLQFYQEQKVHSQMNYLLKHLGSFLQDDQRVYGHAIKHTTILDSIALTTKLITKAYPDTRLIYSQIDKIKMFMAANGADPTNYPMLNISRKDSAYQLMVAIPSNKWIRQGEEIVPKRLVPIKDKTLTTDVRGGVEKVNEAFHQIETYMSDRQLYAPVIPYILLVTDRSKEPDSTKWVSRIYYPIV